MSGKRDVVGVYELVGWERAPVLLNLKAIVRPRKVVSGFYYALTMNRSFNQTFKPPSIMDSSLRERLLTAEVDFFLALSREDKSIQSFEATWDALTQDLSRALRSHALSEETIELAHTIASRISVLSDVFLDIRIRMDDITSKLKNDVDGIFSTLSLADTPRNVPLQQRSITHPLQTPSAIDHSISQPMFDRAKTSTIPVYIAAAYRWLLENLHDPYPSVAKKESIADGAGTDVRHVNSWFINIRRRIGWTALSKKYFAGSRAETVDAAYRVLVAEDPERPLEPDIRLDFMKMMVDAEGLYAEKFGSRLLAVKLDVAVEDSTGGCNVAEETGKPQAPPLINNPALVRPGPPEPSHHRSPSTSPEPISPELSSDASEDNDDNISPPISVAGHKRRISSISSESDDSHHRFFKRFRCVAHYHY